MLLLFLLTQLLTLQEAKTLSEIVQSLGIGIGAALGGAGAFSAISEYSRHKRNERRIRFTRGRYPPDDWKKTFYLYRQHGSNPVYICDIDSKTRSWISSGEIMLKLGYDNNMVEDVTKKELDEYEQAIPVIFD